MKRRKQKIFNTFLKLSACILVTIWLVNCITFINTINDEEDLLGAGMNHLIGLSSNVHNVHGVSNLSRRLEKNLLPKYPLNHRGGHDHDHDHDEDANPSLTLKLSKDAIDMCHRTLWHTLESTTVVLPNNESFVITGDISDLWLRDSAAQIHPLLIPNVYDGKSLVQTDAKLERIVSGLIKLTARYIRHDPYANAFRIDDSKVYNTFEREKLGRHGYIATWNYELDSACYYMRMIYFFYTSFPAHPVLTLTQVQEAVEIMIDLWIAEQRHEEDQYPVGPLFDCEHCGKPYRYNPAELKRNGKGTATNPNTGMTWSGFRPSDDACEYGFLVPSNMFAVVALKYMEELATKLWDNQNLAKKARKLRDEIQAGIQKHGIVKHEKYGMIYAYEVDGLGNSLLMDDANIPNLMSLPYLGYDYDPEIYENTKKFILSEDNPTFHRGKNDFTGEIEGYGSPHTNSIPHDIWPMAIAMQALVSDDSNEKVKLVEKLVEATAGTGWMHESFDANNPKKFSRPWFCWPDSLFAELVMSLTDECPQPGVHKYKVKEWRDKEQPPPKGGIFATA
jgi:meiotically up-regulated gene 157 (Mug157) protein